MNLNGEAFINTKKSLVCSGCQPLFSSVNSHLSLLLKLGTRKCKEIP